MRSWTDWAVSVLRLLLLTQLSSSAPSPHPLCPHLKSMRQAVKELQLLTKMVLHSMESDLGSVEIDSYRLKHLPSMEHSVENISALTLNESLPQLHRGLALFKLHMDWLLEAREGVGLASSPAEGGAPGPAQLYSNTTLHLKKLGEMTGNSLQLLQQEVPPPPFHVLPDVPHTFGVLHYSLEVAARLNAYCRWSQRVLRHVQSGECP